MTDLAVLATRFETQGAEEAARKQDDVARSADRVERSAGNAKRSMDSLSDSQKRAIETANMLGRALGALAGAFITREVIRMADAWSDMNARLGLAIRSQEQSAAVMDRLSVIARRTYSSLTLTTESFIANANVLRELGYQTQQQLDYTEALNLALVVSGARAERASQVQEALSRAMALGRLQGDQLNTVIMNGGRVAEVLAEQLGVNVNQLRELGQQGKITGDVIYTALTSRLQGLQAQAELMPATIGDAFTLMGNAVLRAVGVFDQANGLSERFAQGVIALADQVHHLGTVLELMVAAAAAMSVVFAGRIVASLGAATIASINHVRAEAALLAAIARTTGGALSGSLAMRALGVSTLVAARGAQTLGASMLSLVGGPLGAAIIALTVLTAGVLKAQQQTERFNEATSDFNRLMAEADQLSRRAAEGSGAFGSQNQNAIGPTMQLCDATAALANETYRLADAQAQALRMSMLQRISDNRDQVEDLLNPSWVQRVTEFFVGLRRGIETGGGREERANTLLRQNAALWSQVIDQWASGREKLVQGQESVRGLATELRGLNSATDEAADATARLLERSAEFLAALVDETRQIGMSNIERRMMTIEAEAMAAALAGDDGLAAAIRKAGAEWRTATELFDRNEAITNQTGRLEDMVTQLERQRQSIGTTAEEQALLNAQWAIADLNLGELTPAMQTLIDRILELAPANAAAARETTALLDELRLIDDLARDAGYGMAESFGEAGRALSALLGAMTNLRLEQEAISVARAEGRMTEAQAARQQAALEIQTYGDMASAAKGFFSEKTAAYKALQTVEMVYRGIQFANAVKAMVLEKTEAGVTVAQSAIKSAAHGVVAVARAIASMPFPLNIAAGAATAAALVGFGVKMFGGGGAGGMAALPQTNEGAGTVLGDSSAASQSLSNSLAMAERYQNRDLQYSSQMVDSLRAIQSGISGLTTAIARQMQIGGAFDTSGLGLGASTSRGFLGIGSTTRTSELAGQGLQFSAQTVAQMIERGVQGVIWQAVENTKTKSGFLGIGGGTTTWFTETTRAVDNALSQQFGQVLATLRDGVLTAAAEIGVTGAEATLNALVLNLGRIDFANMSSAEISERLSAIFSAAGDQMAAAVIPGLTHLQQAGEGMFETLVRLATQYTTIDQVMASLGMTFGSVGLASVEARDRLVQLTGGLDEFAKQAEFFSENFLTEAQRLAPIQRAVTEEMARLGLAGITTREAFANVVMGLDVSTEKGAELYAALMRVAPGFDAVVSAAEKAQEALLDGLARDVQEATDTLHSARQKLTEAYNRERSALLSVIAQVDEARDQLVEAYEREVSALRSVIDQVEDARSALQRAYDAEVQSLQSVIQAVDSARDDLRTAYEREIAVLREVVDAVDSARERLRASYEREASALQSIIGAVDAARADLISAYDREIASLRAMAGAVDEARATLQRAYDAQVRVLTATIDAVSGARGDLQDAYDREVRTLNEVIGAVDGARDQLRAAYDREVDSLNAVIGAVDDARARLEQAYQRERSEIEGTIGSLGGLIDTLRTFRQSLSQDEMLPASMRYGAARAQFMNASNDNLPDAGRTFLNASMSASATRLDYLRDLATVRIATAKAEAVAEQQLSEAELQLQELEKAVEGLINLNDATLSVEQAVSELRSAILNAGEAEAQLAVLRDQVSGLMQIDESVLSVAQAVSEMQSALASSEQAQQQLAALNEQVGALLGLDAGVLSVEEAIARMQLALTEGAQAQAELDALNAQVEGLLGLNDGVVSVGAAIAGLQTALANAAQAEAQIAALEAQAGHLVAANDNLLSVGQALERFQQAVADADRAQAQLDALNASVAGLIDLNDGVGSVAQAIAELRDAMEAADQAQAMILALEQQVAGLLNGNEAVLSVAEAIARLQAAMTAGDAAQVQLDALNASVAGLLNVEQATLSVAEAIANMRAAMASAEQAQAQIEALDRQVAGLINLNESVLSVSEAVARMLSAQQAAEQAQAQIEALDRSVEGLLTVNESVLSVADGILGVQNAMGALAAAQAAYAAATAAAAAQANAAILAALNALRDPVVTTQPIGPIEEVVVPPILQPPGVPGGGIGNVPGAYDPDPGQWWSDPFRDTYVKMQKFAEGGVFTSPTTFQMGDQIGQMAEAGPEAIMPLVQTSGGLGVRAVNDNDGLIEEIRALRQEVSRLRAENSAENQAMVGRLVDIDRRDRRQEVDGIYVRGDAPGEPVKVKDAA